jgi:hypothetical protein
VGTLASLAVTGNVTAGNVSATTFTGALTGAATSATTAGTVTTAAQGNITSVGTLTSLSVSGNIIAGNLDAINLVVNNISSDDSTLVSVQDGLQVYGNIVADNLGNIASINLDGNVSNVLSGTGTWIPAGAGGAITGTSVSVSGNVTAGNVGATGIAGTLSTAAQGNITSVGTLTALAVTGNVTAGNVSATTFTGALTGAATTAGTVTTAAQSNITSVGTLSSVIVTGNVTGGNLLTAGVVSATGNVTGNYFIGNGSQLTGIAGGSYGNANVAANLAAFGSNPISTTGNITAGNVSATGIAGTLSTAAQTSITSVGTLTALAVTGNIIAGNLAAINLVVNSIASDDSSYVNIEDGLTVAGEISATGNVTAGNVSATGSILAVPAWTSAGAITFTATTTSPTKGTTTSDNISYRQLGAKQWEIILTYIQTVANGVNGSGDYLVTLPNSLSFDTTLPSQQITTTNIGTNTYALMSYIIPSGSGLINNDTLGGQVYPIVYDATKFRILTTTYGSAIQCWGSGYYSLGGDDPKIQLTFSFTST